MKISAIALVCFASLSSGCIFSAATPQEVADAAPDANVADAAPTADTQTPTEMRPGTDPSVCHVNGQVRECAVTDGCPRVQTCVEQRWGTCIATRACGSSDDAGTPPADADQNACPSNGALLACMIEGRPGYRECASNRWSQCRPLGSTDAGTADSSTPDVTDAAIAADVVTDAGSEVVIADVARDAAPDTTPADSATVDTGVVDAGTDTGSVDSGPAIVGNDGRADIIVVTAGLRGSVEIREINPIAGVRCSYTGTGVEINQCRVTPRYVESVGRFEFGVYVNGVSAVGISDESCRLTVSDWQIGVFDASNGREVETQVRSTGTSCVLYVPRFYSWYTYYSLSTFESDARWYISRATDAGVTDSGVADSGRTDSGTDASVDTGVTDAGPCAGDVNLGRACNNGRSGVCARTGTYVCNTTTNRAECNAPAVTGTAETCNGLDDDCNGTVDDGLGTTTCGNGICSRTVNNCVAGVRQVCAPGTAASTETCGNGIDDNCNGSVDEGCSTTDAGGVATGRYVYEVQTPSSLSADYGTVVPQFVNQWWSPQTCLNTGSLSMERLSDGSYRCVVAARLEVFAFSYSGTRWGFDIGVVQPSSTVPVTCAIRSGVVVRAYAEGSNVNLFTSGSPRAVAVDGQCRVGL